MKNLSTLLLIFLLAQTSSYPQETKDFRKFGLGVVGAVHPFGKIYNSQNMKSTSGVMAGLDLRYSISKSKEGFSLHLQPNYSTFKQVLEDGNEQNQFYWRDNWKWKAVNVPLLIRYTLPTGKVRPFFETGVNFRFRTALSVRSSGHICGIVSCGPVDRFINLQKETTQDKIGIISGVGAEIDVWNITIPVSVRINEGIGEFEMKEQMADSYYFSGLKTRTLQISAGISF